MKVLEPQLRVLALVARGLRKDVRDLDVPLLLGLARIVGVLVGRLALTRKGRLEVLLGLRILKIHCHVCSSHLLHLGALKRAARPMVALRAPNVTNAMAKTFALKLTQ